MKKFLLFYATWMVAASVAHAYVGETFTSLTEEGVEMTFVVTDEEGKTCQVGVGDGVAPCVSKSTRGCVTVPQSACGYRVTALAGFAFYMCEGVTSVILPEGITSIGSEAFSQSGVSHLSIPASVTSIGIMPFPHLSTVTVSSGNLVYSSPEGSNAVIETAGNSLVAGCGGTVIPPDVASIGAYALAHCPVETVEIPRSVSRIGGYAFSWSGIRSIEIPEGITVLESGLFEHCGKLTSVVLHDGIESVRPRCFSSCGSLSSICLPGSLRTLGHSSFAQCESLEEIVIPEGVEEIPDYAFIQCSSLSDVRLPESLRRIGDGAFAACFSLDSISLPSRLSELGSAVFLDAPISSIRLYSTDPPKALEGTFIGNYQARLYVPAGCAEVYRNTEVWENFTDLVEFEASDIVTAEAPLRNLTVYDLQGRRLSAPPSHGVYIQGGRKLVR